MHAVIILVISFVWVYHLIFFDVFFSDYVMVADLGLMTISLKINEGGDVVVTKSFHTVTKTSIIKIVVTSFFFVVVS